MQTVSLMNGIPVSPLGACRSPFPDPHRLRYAGIASSAKKVMGEQRNKIFYVLCRRLAGANLCNGRIWEEGVTPCVRGEALLCSGCHCARYVYSEGCVYVCVWGRGANVVEVISQLPLLILEL